MAEDPKPFKKLASIFKRSAESDAGKILGSILRETPIGKAGRIIKDIADIFDGDESEDALAEAMKNATPEQIVQLETVRNDLAMALVNERVEARREETTRWTADMMSDSWLSKNVRPLALIVSFSSSILYGIISAICASNSELTLEQFDYLIDVGGNLHELASWAFGFYATLRGGEKIANTITTRRI